VVAVAVFSSLYRGMKFLSFLFLFLSCFSFFFFSRSCLSGSFFFILCFCFVFVSLLFPSFVLPYFFLFLLCFWLSSLPFSYVYLFVFVSRPLVFIRGQGAERATIPVQSWRKGRVAGRSLCIHPRAAHVAFLICLFHHSGRP